MLRHFVLYLMFLTLLGFASRSSADAFREISAGNYVRIGEHSELTAKTQRGIANIGFIVGEKSIAIIDPGGNAADADAIKAAIATRSNLPISHIILTHFHPDHVLAGQAFANVAHVIAHQRYPSAVAQRGEHYAARFAALLGENVKVSWLQPTQLVAQDLYIDLGNRKLRVQAHPTAHTDNDLTVFDEKTATLWASDLVFETRVPALDGSLIGWLDVMQNLAKFEPAMVIPGHGEPGNWTAVVSPQLHYLEKLLDNTRELIQSGKSLNDALAAPQQNNNSTWLLFDDYHPRNITKAYAELEWE